MYRTFLLLMSCFFSVACSTTTANVSGADSEAASTVASSGFKALASPPESLGPGDVFELKVIGEPDLSGKYRVSGSEVTLPLIGKLSVTGLALTEFEALIRERFKVYLKNPQVSVLVEDFKGRKVYVFGRVNKPGTMPYESGMSLIEVITDAGGLHELANGDETTITRVVDGKEIKVVVSVKAIRQGDISNVPVFPGDIVFVPESIF